MFINLSRLFLAPQILCKPKLTTPIWYKGSSTELLITSGPPESPCQPGIPVVSTCPSFVEYIHMKNKKCIAIIRMGIISSWHSWMICWVLWFKDDLVTGTGASYFAQQYESIDWNTTNCTENKSKCNDVPNDVFMMRSYIAGVDLRQYYIIVTF